MNQPASQPSGVDERLPNQARSAPPVPAGARRRAVAAACGVALVTGVVFSRSLGAGFINLDDNIYVYDNPLVRGGLSSDALAWLPTAVVGGNWHPLAVLSHMIDCQLYGLDPWGHHLTAVALHALSSGLLCLALWRLSGQLWPSAVAALLFGVHPLRVESVTWVAERKDVLSGVFWMLSLLAYAAYAQRGRATSYLVLLVALALGLTAKPMLVTLPFVLLLVDYWPLACGDLGGSAPAGWPWPADAARRRAARGWTGLVAEKLPLLALVAATSAVTYWAQSSQGAVRSSAILSFRWRLMNAAVAYAEYVGQTVWPARLAVFYPHPTHRLKLASAAAAAIGLVLVTWLAWRQRGTRPYLLVGWLWFVGTLVPVIGLVQIGGHARADRYTYLPSIGLALVAAWLLAEWGRRGNRERLATAAAAGLVAVLGLVCWRQQGHWLDSQRLFAHTAAVTRQNFLALDQWGEALLSAGRPGEALERLDESLAIFPDYPLAVFHRAAALGQLKRYDEALAAYDRAIALGLADPYTQTQRADVLARLERLPQALAALDAVLAAAPDFGPALALRARLEARAGRTAGALSRLREAQRARPGDPHLAAALAWLLATHPDPMIRDGREALAVARRACAGQTAGDPELWLALAAAEAEAGNFAAALEAVDRAAAQHGDPGVNTPWPQELSQRIARHRRAYAAGRPWREAP